VDQYSARLVVLALGLFLGVLAFHEIGRRLGLRRRRRDPDGAAPGGGAIDAAVFALFGLLVAFTFSGAASRFEIRRQLIVEEANAIGTAWLRLDLLAPGDRTALRDAFRRYLDRRLEVYARLPDLAAAYEALAESAKLQQEIWQSAVAASARPEGQRATVVLLPALNEMIDVTTKRTTAGQLHPPKIIYVLLIGFALGCGLLAGYGSASAPSRDWTRAVAFAAVVAVTIHVIFDLEYPRLGLIRVDAADRLLLELRESMG
jgi:hypothetical protein